MYLSPPFRPRTILLAVVTITLIFFILFTARSAAPHAYLRNSWLDFVRHKDHLHTSPTPSNPGDGRVANATLLELASTYHKAFFDPSDNSLPRLECPSPTHTRYDYLRHEETGHSSPSPLPKYFFALDLHQCINILPRLIGTLIETIRFLGPENCVLSIVEGVSDDGTYEVLMSARKEIEKMGTKYFFHSSDLNPKITERISTLAKLRNLAVKPLVKDPKSYDPETTIVFINDISLCREDILELIHQRRYLGADMTCAMDWTYVGPDPTFYDVWIARTMTGETFFEIPPDGSWNNAWNLFWNSPTANERYHALKPFQVFSCWNGATAFTAKPLLENKIQFRSSTKKECYQGEPRLWCKDMWKLGYGKIAVIPTVNVEYSDEGSTKIKALKGYVSSHVSDDGTTDSSDKISWQQDPPAQVKCISDPDYSRQHFVPWDQGLS